MPHSQMIMRKANQKKLDCKLIKLNKNKSPNNIDKKMTAIYHPNTQLEKHDSYMTPKYAWENIKNYLAPYKEKIVWEAFYGDGKSAEYLNELGMKNVIHKPFPQYNFFTYQPDNFDIVISNPPFSKSKEVLTRLKELNKPFCLIIASDFPHGPFPKTSNYTKQDIYKLPYDPSYVGNHKPGYYQNIQDDNDQLGKVLEMVDKYGHEQNTMFIYASDHGLSGKWSLQEQGIRLPFIVRWPGKIKPNTTSETLLTLVDVLPTILEVSKTKIPRELDGKSFVESLKGDDKQINEYVYGVATRQNIRECKIFPSRMVRGKRFKLIRNFNSIEVVNSNLGENPIINSFAKIGAESFPNVPYEELYD